MWYWERESILHIDGRVSPPFSAMDGVCLFICSVGKLLVAAMLAPDVSRNAALIVNSFTCTPAQIANEYQKQTGDKWEISTTSLEKLRELEKEAYANKHPAATAFTLRRIWTEGGTLYTHRDNEKLGDVQLETMEEQVKKNIGDQTGKQPVGSPIMQLSST